MGERSAQQPDIAHRVGQPETIPVHQVGPVRCDERVGRAGIGVRRRQPHPSTGCRVIPKRSSAAPMSGDRSIGVDACLVRSIRYKTTPARCSSSVVTDDVDLSRTVNILSRCARLSRSARTGGVTLRSHNCSSAGCTGPRLTNSAWSPCSTTNARPVDSSLVGLISYSPLRPKADSKRPTR